MGYHRNAGETSDHVAFLLWCPDFCGINNEPFAYVYSAKAEAERAKDALLEVELFNTLSCGKRVGENIKRLRARAKDIRIDPIPLLIGGSDLRGL